MKHAASFLLCLILVTFKSQAQNKSIPEIKIDYSFAGFRGSDNPIPFVSAKLVLKPGGKDDTYRLQAAIDAISKMPIGADGFRGTILLKEGRYNISGILKLRADGIVLRGSGPATVLVATGTDRRALIEAESLTIPSMDQATALEISNEALKSGSQSFRVKDLSTFKTGDEIAIVRPSTKEWIGSLGMDTLSGVFPDLRFRWTPGSRDLTWFRTITSINAQTNTLTINAPITTDIKAEFGGAKVFRVLSTDHLSNIGFENFSIESEYNKGNLKDEEHAWFGIRIGNVQDTWIRNVNSRYLASSLVFVSNAGRRVTIQNCNALTPVAEIGGYRRQSFWVEGQQVLLSNCSGEDGINSFVAGFCSAGPNVFYNCTALNALGANGTLESWASGVLYDGVKVNGNALKISYDTKRTQESGWTAANSILWNCKASELTAKGPTEAPCYLINADYSLFEKQLINRIGTQSAAAILQSQTSFPGTHEENALLFEIKDQNTETSSQLDSRNKLEIINGRFVINNKAIWGGSVNDAWWLGKSIPGAALNAGVSISRFVPGKTGAGLTEDLPVLATRMKQQGISFYQSGPAIWYDRRRDEHSIKERFDGDVWPAFYELPWARSGEGKAWDGLSKYDLGKYNIWYFNRMKAFSELANKHGFLLYHHLYNNHNLQETASHWADFPWRPANNINTTGLPEPPPLEPKERVHVTNKFYDEKNLPLIALHRKYIFHALNQLADSPNIIFGLSFQYSGTLAFQQFFQKTVAEWEKKAGKKVRLVIDTGKELTDSILADPELSKQIAVIDMRYWHYLPDGSLWAPKAGLNKAFRELQPKEFGDATTPKQIYRQVREYHDKYPDKALVVWHAGAGQVAALMGGAAQVLTQNPTAGHGQGTVLDRTVFDEFVNTQLADKLMAMQPKDNFIKVADENWALADRAMSKILLYSLSGESIYFTQKMDLRQYTGIWFNPAKGTLLSANLTGTRLKSISKPDNGDWLLLLTKSTK